jgi:putative phosphoribosyl transferase
VFESRTESGGLLAGKLLNFQNRRDVIVFGIPRGGIVVAKRVSDILNVPLNTLVVKKVGDPNQPELAIGAVAVGGIVVNESSGLDENITRQLFTEAAKLVSKRAKLYEKYEKRQVIGGKTAILVDDGIATGATVLAAIKYLKKKKAKEIVLAIPIATQDAVEKFQKIVDKVVVLETPSDFYAVGQFYRNFPQVTDEEVIKILSK